MSNQEKLVPPLEECEKIPDGAFADSALVWGHTGEGYEVTSREVWKLVEILFPAVPAPTLTEILETITPCPTVYFHNMEWHVNGGFVSEAKCLKNEQSHRTNPAAAALRLWFRIREVEG